MEYKQLYERARARHKQALKMGCPLRDAPLPDYVHCETAQNVQAVLARLKEADARIRAAVGVASVGQSDSASESRTKAPASAKRRPQPRVPDVDALAEFPRLARKNTSFAHRQGGWVKSAAVDHSQDIWGGLVKNAGKKWGDYGAPSAEASADDATTPAPTSEPVSAPTSEPESEPASELVSEPLSAPTSESESSATAAE